MLGPQATSHKRKPQSAGEKVNIVTHKGGSETREVESRTRLYLLRLISVFSCQSVNTPDKDRAESGPGHCLGFSQGGDVVGVIARGG